MAHKYKLQTTMERYLYAQARVEHFLSQEEYWYTKREKTRSYTKRTEYMGYYWDARQKSQWWAKARKYFALKLGAGSCDEIKEALHF